VPVRDQPPRIVITGAAHGIGRLCALSLSDWNLELILSDHDGAGLSGLCSSLGCLGRFCDVASEASVAVFAEDLLDNFYAIDGLIIVAGGGHIRSLGMWRVARALMPALRRSDGALIVNIGPSADPRRHDYEFPYASSEEAFHEITSALVTATRGSGVEVASVAGAGPSASRQARHPSVCASEVLGLVARRFGLPPFGRADQSGRRRA